MKLYNTLWAGVSLSLPGKLRAFFLLISVLLYTVTANAQISGSAFRDFNGNGTRENTSGAFVEPLVPGVIVTAYSNSDVILASYTTSGATDPNYTIPASGSAYNGTKGSGTGFVPNGTAVRLEFTIPMSTACLVSSVYDFTSKSGKVYGTSVRFLASSGGARTANNFALNNPSDYVAGATPKSSTYIFQAMQFSGNPLAGGTAAAKNALVKYPYDRSGTTALAASEILATAAQVGAVNGVAYSKYAKKVFTSAFMKRHSGFGPADGSGSAAAYAPGTIYMANPALTSTTGATSFFISLDKKGYPTHNSTGSPAYASAFTLSSSGSALTRTETVTFNANGLGVIGTNAERGLPANMNIASNDAAAFGQVGKVSLGDIEMSEDGKFLFVVNLFDRKIYQFQLNSVTNPTDASYVNSWNLPNPPARSGSGLAGAATTYASANANFYNGTVGLQRPFALKYRNGKLYVGSVTTGEGTGAVSTTDDNTGNVEYTDLWSYVWELNPSSGFTAAPVLQIPLNYARGTNDYGFDERWRPWSNTMPESNINTAASGWALPQPMLSGIEFDVDGSMILSFRDRAGDQGGTFNSMLSGATSRTVMALGDQLRAYKNPSGCAYQLESNGKEGASSPKAATAGAGTGQGPGGGEFYYQDGLEVYNGNPSTNRLHLNLAMGSLALLPGSEEVAATYMDAVMVNGGGVSWMNSNTGANSRDYQLYFGIDTGDLGKANGLGDIELLFENPPIEIGNRVWKDLDADGIQDAEEPAIAGVVLELLNATGTVLGTVTTAADGTWYFSSDTGTDATGIKYGVALEPATAYRVRLATSGAGNDWDPTANSGAGGPRAGGDLVGLVLTGTNKTGNGEADFSDSDASLVSSIPQISLTTGGYGENNHTYDIGFVEPVNLGNKVWKDANNNGIMDSGESGFAGVTVNLYEDANNDGVADGPAIKTVTTDPSGLYLFDKLTPGTYIVGVVTPSGFTSSSVDGGDPDNDTDDNDDNGVLTVGNETRSNSITLASGGEPTNDNNPDNNPAGGIANNSSNLTVDFGFYDKALPVKLLNFNGKVSDANQVDLTWSTSEELNSSHFEIQRSANGKDWNNIGQVSAQGESRISQAYYFTDMKPSRGDNMYRLKMVDLDATFSYSRIINMKIENAFSLTLFPNPASDRLTITASNGSAIQKVQIYSLIGKLVQEVTAPQNGELNVQSYAAGTYMLRILSADGSVEVRRIAIVR